MSSLQKTIYDCITGETITRDYNSEELAQLSKDIAEAKLLAEAKAKLIEAQDRKRREVLDRLGITADEAKLLLS